MNIKKNPLHYLALLLFISICLTSCTPAAEIIVACDVGDLIDAINDANANSDTTRLILDPNCTYPINSVDNTTGSAGPNGLPLITTKIKITGNNSTLTKPKAFGNRFFFITNSGNLVLEDITLENGYPFRGENPNPRGGAIYNDGGAFRAVRSVFFENSANDGKGGAIYNLGILTLEDTLFESNFSDNGGAIYNGGTMDIPAVLQDVTFDSNTAHGNGGALYNASSEAGLLIAGSTFNNNHSNNNGGAIFSEAGDLNISNSEFLENLAGLINTPTPVWGNGGAIYSLAGDVNLTATQFNLQTAYGMGGILYGGPSSNVMLREVRSEESKACHGGGALYVEGETGILDTTLKSSRAGGHAPGWGLPSGTYSTECWDHDGGAIYNSGNLTLNSSTFEDFYAMGDGDGIFNLGDLIAVNSTFHYDCCSSKEAVNNHGNAELVFSTLMYSGLNNSGNMSVKNIVVADKAIGCINSGTFVDWGENIALDPTCPFSIILANQYELGISTSLSDNGGPTFTHRVESDSPVINMATSSSISGGPVLVDQRGETRPFPSSGSHTSDIGAYEVHDLSQPPPPPLPPSPNCDPFQGEEISLMMQSLPADTRIQVMYLKVEGGKIPGLDPEELNGELPYEYEANLGTLTSYLCGLQDFPDRLYCLFHIPEGMDGTAQLYELRLNDCPDPVFNQPNVLIPIPIPASSGPSGPSVQVCRVDLKPQECEAAGGKMSSGVQTVPRCICP